MEASRVTHRTPSNDSSPALKHLSKQYLLRIEELEEITERQA